MKGRDRLNVDKVLSTNISIHSKLTQRIRFFETILMVFIAGKVGVNIWIVLAYSIIVGIIYRRIWKEYFKQLRLTMAVHPWFKNKDKTKKHLQKLKNIEDAL